MAQVQASNPLGILGHKKSTPSADDLLSIKLLCETDTDFSHLKEESVLFLKNAMRMLASSPFLRTKFGGDGIQEASVLAQLLKQRADTLNFQLHIDDMSRQLLSREFRKVNMTGLRPKRVPVFDPTGQKYAEPVNMLGLRRPMIGGNRRNDAAIIGSEEVNAYGRSWNSSREQQNNRWRVNDLIDQTNDFRERIDFGDNAHFRRDRNYLYG